MTDKISEKDKKDWENFLSKKEKLPNKDINFTREKKLKKKIMIYKLIVVTGKGLHSQNEKDPYVSKDLSILRYSVPHFIKNNNELMKMINDFDSATIEDGGSGAFYIYIKKKV